MELSNIILMIGQINDLKKQNKSLQNENRILKNILLNEVPKDIKFSEDINELIERLRNEQKSYKFNWANRKM